MIEVTKKPEELCPGPKVDVLGWEWDKKENKDDKEYSTLIIKM